ncbi:MAG TPA: hypothetical protein GXZ47_01905 [Treponema sp.]|nr:hypothetical protein [Treponema sp.]
MNTTKTVTAGDSLHGFDIISVQDLPELESKGVFARHRETGCEVYHMVNEDEENLFSYSFMTPPADSTGVAHILEHSVLCGSKNYPLKDPFLLLAKQSVKTFLNAMTFPDKTVYPASSMVEADYFNLMSVYGDAVFFPLLEPWIFRQEGHRIEPAADGTFSVQGVVFNEMRGNYSSFERIAGSWTIRSILEGTPYAYDSGGDPLCISDLTYEQFKEFHRTYYHPVNCRIFLYGNIPTAKQLEFLTRKFLSNFSAAPACPKISAVVPYKGPRTLSVPAPAQAEDDLSLVTVHMNWLLPEVTDAVSIMEASLVSEILLGHDGALLNRALLCSELGEDVAPSSGLETELQYLCYSAGLRGVKHENAETVGNLVMATLRSIAETGIPQEEIEAAVHSIDFANREIRRAGGPFALNHMRRSLRGWIHGLGPECTLRYIPAFETVKERLEKDPEYITGLIKKWFLDNTHRVLVTIYPDPDYELRVDEQLKIIVEKATRTEDDKKRLKLEKQALLQQQQKLSTPEELSLIPHLARSDLPLLTEPIPSDIGSINSVPLIQHEQPTNGIAYVDIAFPVDTLSPEEYLLLPLFSTVLTSTGFDGVSWVEASAQSARCTGGLGTMLFTCSSVPDYTPPKVLGNGVAGRDYLIIRLKMLETLIEPAIDLTFRFIENADFTDIDRLNDLLAEYRNDLEASIAPAGNHYALSLASALTGRSKAVDELWSGITQLKYVRTLYKTSREKAGLRTISDRLVSIREKIHSSGMLVSLTGTESILTQVQKALLPHVSRFSAPSVKKATSAEELFSLIIDGVAESERLLVEATLQVGFAATVQPSSRLGEPDHPVEIVLGHLLASGPLWERIRMTGGAYGAFCYPDALEGLFIFSSYRDPSPLASIDVYYTALSEAAKTPLDTPSLEKIIIGCYSREVQPRSPSDKGFISFVRLLYGITDALRTEKIEGLLSVTPEDLMRTATALLERLNQSRHCIFAGKKYFEENKSVTGTGKIHKIIL